MSYYRLLRRPRQARGSRRHKIKNHPATIRGGRELNEQSKVLPCVFTGSVVSDTPQRLWPGTQWTVAVQGTKGQHLVYSVEAQTAPRRKVRQANETTAIAISFRPPGKPGALAKFRVSSSGVASSARWLRDEPFDEHSGRAETSGEVLNLSELEKSKKSGESRKTASDPSLDSVKTEREDTWEGWPEDAESVPSGKHAARRQHQHSYARHNDLCQVLLSTSIISAMMCTTCSGIRSSTRF